MAYRHRESKPPFDIDEARRLYHELKSYRKVARQLDSNYAAVYRALNPEASVTPNGTPHEAEPPPSHHPIDTACTNVELDLVVPVHEDERAPTMALQPVEVTGASEHTHAQPYAQLLARVEALESHQAVVDAYLATWQAMHKAAQPMHTAAVQAMHTDVHTWEHPDDAKPERWNLLLPRGLKREIDAQAKAAGIPASTLVTRLLMAAVHTHAQAMHTAEGE
jgi:hypothetical protein